MAIPDVSRVSIASIQEVIARRGPVGFFATRWDGDPDGWVLELHAIFENGEQVARSDRNKSIR